MSLVARLSFFAAVLSGAVLVVLPAVSSAADPLRIDVVDNAYDDGDRDGNDEEGEDGNENRNHTVVHAGETVQWVWKGDNEHTVTSQPTSPVAFDSDSECAEAEENTDCRTEPNTFAVRFEQPGTYEYFCKVHGLLMTGTIEVQEAPEPSESESGSSEPSPEPTSEEASSEPEPSESGSSPEPQEEPSEGPTPDDGATGAQDDPTGSDTADDRPTRRQATGPGFGVQREPQTDPPAEPGPEVAPETVPAPSFSPFPTAPDLPSGSETEDMTVTVPGRDAGGPSRGVVVGVAVASLIGSAGAFGKVVLFGPPWG